MNHEPLKPDPEWENHNNAGWSSQTAQVLGNITHPPAAYAQGFNDGAYALAEKLLTLFMSSAKDDAYRLLLEYKAGHAKPVKGWQHAPPRA